MSEHTPDILREVPTDSPWDEMRDDVLHQRGVLEDLDNSQVNEVLDLLDSVIGPASMLLEACKAAHAAYELWGPPEDPTPQDLAEHEGEYVALAGLATHLAAAIAAAEGE